MWRKLLLKRETQRAEEAAEYLECWIEAKIRLPTPGSLKLGTFSPRSTPMTNAGNESRVSRFLCDI